VTDKRRGLALHDPVVSVITVVRNGAATVADALYSVACQTYAHVEHIVIDGASTDGTQAVVRQHGARVATFVSESDEGLYYAMNKGIGLAKGEIIGFLNSDDVYSDEQVLGDVAVALQNPAVDACYGDLVYVAREAPGRVVRYWKSREYAAGLVERGWMPAHPTFFIRKRILEEIGGFNTRYRLQADYDLMIRLFILRGIRTVYLPRIMVKMRLGGHTNRSLRNIVSGNLEAYAACKENGIPVGPLFILRKLASRLPQFLRRVPR
jgi:glycosyltransferase involved in cell wall biosynthesis